MKPFEIEDACTELVGRKKIIEAKLLTKIVRWMSHATVVYDNHLWVAKTNEEWADETKLSFHTVKRAKTELLRKGLITTCQRFYGRRCMGHVRTTDKVPFVSNIPELARCKSAPPGWSKSALPGWSTSAPPSLETDTNKTIQETSGQKPAKGQGAMKQKSGKKAKDVIASLEKMHKPDNTHGLGLVWQEEYANVVSYAPCLNGKQMSLLKTFLVNAPEGKAQEIVAYVIQNWVDFTKKTQIEDGAFNTPMKPQVEFFSKHQGTAVQFWMAQEAQPLDEAPPEKPAFAQNKQLQSIAIEKDKASLDEVMKLLNDGG